MRPVILSQLAALNHELPNTSNAASPFELGNESGYQSWRADKLRLRSELQATSVVELVDSRVDDEVASSMSKQLKAFGFFAWQTSEPLNDIELLAFNRQFGLSNIDDNPGAGEHAITHLQVVSEDDQRARYIPYSNRGLNWHTDGYYNPASQRIRSFCLYCVNPAVEGGENFLFDQELLYIRLRDHDPKLVAAMMAADALTIPANEQQGIMLREAERGPVFSIGLSSRRLHMRYSTRPKNIVWKQQADLQQALELTRQILSDESEDRVSVRLKRGQGVLTNNILHGRTTFTDGDKPRLMYRARYYDEIVLPDGMSPHVESVVG